MMNLGPCHSFILAKTLMKQFKMGTSWIIKSIWITKDSIPAKKGAVISEKLATLLSKLDVKPVEAGISLDAAVAEDILYAKNELVIDVEKYRNAFAQAHQEAMSLAIEIGYVTKENISLIIAKAAQRARSVALEAGYLTDENKEQTIQKAYAQAKALVGKAKSYSPQ